MKVFLPQIGADLGKRRPFVHRQGRPSNTANPNRADSNSVDLKSANPGKVGPHGVAAITDAAAPQEMPDELSEPEVKEQVVEAIRSVYDPEIPVNVYDLGLIYGIELLPNANAIAPMTYVAKIRMTLTAPACPVAGQLVEEVRANAAAATQISDAQVELVWDPPWDQSRMSDEARLELGLM